MHELGTHWGLKWILTENFKFWIKSNIILTLEVVKILLYKNKLLLTNILKHSQKQTPEMFYEKSCSQKFCNIHRKTPVLENAFRSERY